MPIRGKIIVRQWLQSVVVWILIVYFYGLLTVFGFKAYFAQSPVTDYIYSGFFHLEIILTGVILGSLFVWIHRITDVPAIRKRSFGFNIFIKSILYVFSLLLCTIIIFNLFRALEFVSKEQMQFYREYLLDFRYMSSVIMYFFFFILLTNFFVQINKKFGPGELISLLSGKFYHPGKENLILLFIDLKSSTTIAESLGHETYSNFLKECVHELTPALVKYQGSVYQYVGDEIVLYWKTEKGQVPSQCPDTFFAFKKRLALRGQYFLDKYGFIPEFKAGMEVGEVTITEIGDLKREIAFHGDVLNTAARLEKKCNEFDSWLLVTQNVLDKFPEKDLYRFEFKSDLPLRGKHERIRFYAVSEK